jgi:hypothetical protein
MPKLVEILITENYLDFIRGFLKHLVHLRTSSLNASSAYV